jgi:hypothetical protein
MNIFKWFTKPKEKKQKEPRVMDITLSVLTTGQIEINFFWIKHSKEMAALTAELLYKLNEGHFWLEFIEILEEYSKKHHEYHHFVSEIKTCLESAIKNTDNQPLISPRKALKFPYGIVGLDNQTKPGDNNEAV